MPLADKSTTTIAAVEIVGAPPRLAATLARLIATTPGMVVSEAPLQQDLRRLWQSGVVADADIELGGTSRDRVRFVVTVRPPIGKVTVRGGDRDLARRFALLEGTRYEPTRLARMAEASELAYRRSGRLDATVDVTTRSSRQLGGVDVCVAANPGPMVTISEIRFAGRTAIGERDLLAALTKGGETNRPGGLYDADAFGNGVIHLQAAYWDRGYALVEVAAPRLVRLGERLVIELVIREGELFRIGAVTTNGFTRAPLTKLAGARFSRSEIVEAKDRLQTALDASDVTPLTKIDLERRVINIYFEASWQWPWQRVPH